MSPFRKYFPYCPRLLTRRQRLTSPEIDSHRAERHRPCPAPHARAQARRLSWREAHRPGVCQCTHISMHTHSHRAVPQRVQTHGVRAKGADICGRSRAR